VAPHDVGDDSDRDGRCATPVHNELAHADLNRSIEQLINRTETARDECGAVTTRLEDRVQLGARMLRAFEVQIGRAEEVLKRLVAQVEAEQSTALTDRVTHLEARLAELERDRNDQSGSVESVSHSAPLVEQVMNVVRAGLREEFAALVDLHSGSIVSTSTPPHRPRLS